MRPEKFLEKHSEAMSKGQQVKRLEVLLRKERAMVAALRSEIDYGSCASTALKAHMWDTVMNMLTKEFMEQYADELDPIMDEALDNGSPKELFTALANFALQKATDPK